MYHLYNTYFIHRKKQWATIQSWRQNWKRNIGKRKKRLIKSRWEWHLWPSRMRQWLPCEYTKVLCVQTCVHHIGLIVQLLTFFFTLNCAGCSSGSWKTSMLASVRAFAAVGSPRAHNSAPNFRRTTGASAMPPIHRMSTGKDISTLHLKAIKTIIPYQLPQVLCLA